MGSEIETAVRELLRTVVREVVFETEAARSRDYRSNQSENKNLSLLLNSREAAQALSISEPHLSRLTRIGVIPHVRVGKCLRYSLDALEKWIRQSESTESPTHRTTTKKLERPKLAEKAPLVPKASTKPRSKTLPGPVETKNPKKKAIAPLVQRLVHRNKVQPRLKTGTNGIRLSCYWRKSGSTAAGCHHTPPAN